MQVNDQMGDLFDRLRVGFWRRCRPGVLLADPGQRAVHDRLRGFNPRPLTRTPVADTRFVVIDTETTGVKAYAGDEIVSLALIELQGLELTGQAFTTLVNPQRAVPPTSTAIHRLTNADVADAPVITDVLQDVVTFLGECVLVGHHVHFDLCFLNKALQKQFLCRLRYPCLDTMMLYLAVSGRMNHQTLDQVARFCQVETCGRHTAYGDAMMTAAVFKRLALRLTEDSCPVSRLFKWQTGVRYLSG